MVKKDSQKKPEQNPGSKEDNSISGTEFYALTEHWKSDMKFFGDELNFLDILIDKYFLRLTEGEENISKIRPLVTRLSGIEARRRTLDQKITKHLHHVQELMGSSFPHDSFAFNDEHVAMERDLIDFVKDFRAIKGEIFNLTKQVLKSEKAKHLLGY